MPERDPLCVFLSNFIKTEATVKPGKVTSPSYHHLPKRRVGVKEESVLEIQRSIFAIVHLIKPATNATCKIDMQDRCAKGLDTYTTLLGLSSLNILEKIPVMRSMVAILSTLMLREKGLLATSWTGLAGATTSAGIAASFGGVTGRDSPSPCNWRR